MAPGTGMDPSCDAEMEILQWPLHGMRIIWPALLILWPSKTILWAVLFTIWPGRVTIYHLAILIWPPGENEIRPPAGSGRTPGKWWPADWPLILGAGTLATDIKKISWSSRITRLRKGGHDRFRMYGSPSLSRTKSFWKGPLFPCRGPMLLLVGFPERGMTLESWLILPSQHKEVNIS